MSPVYEYICSRCGLRLEMKLPYSQSGATQRCPECEAKLIKVWSAPLVNYDFPSIKVQDMMDKEIRADKEGRLKGL